MKYSDVEKKLRFKYPDAQILPHPDDAEDEVLEMICEVEPTKLHPDFSVAVAVINQTPPHYHEVTTETYEILSGSLTLYRLGQKAVELFKGVNPVIIKPGVVHWAKSDGEAWVRVTSRPGWTAKDHIPYQIKRDGEADV